VAGRDEGNRLWREELRETLALAWPLVLTNFTQALIPATDVVLLGWAGKEKLAAASLGAERVVVFTRTPTGAAPLEELGTDLGMRVEARGRDTHTPAFAPDAVISTIPGGTHHGYSFDHGTMSHSVLFDVAYDPWPSTLATEWLAAGGSVISGLEMLLHQALAQVRIFVSGDPASTLPSEAAVLAAMRASIS